MSRIIRSPTVKLTPYFFQSDQGFFSQIKDPEIDSPKLKTLFYQVTLKQGVAESRVQKHLFSSYMNNE